ncbi:hypothetical protein D9M68_603580 [compost metagenome]
MRFQDFLLFIKSMAFIIYSIPEVFQLFFQIFQRFLFFVKLLSCKVYTLPELCHLCICTGQEFIQILFPVLQVIKSLGSQLFFSFQLAYTRQQVIKTFLQAM